MKRWIVTASMVVVLASVAGCGSTPGQPEPATTGTSASALGTSDDPGTSSISQAGGGNVADMNSCSLLTASEATSVGLPSGGYTQNEGAKSGCEWDGPSYTVSVIVRTNVGLAGVLANGGTVTNAQIGSHQAKQVQETSGGCLYAIGIDDSTRVDINAQGDSGTACPESLSVARLVEKHLP